MKSGPNSREAQRRMDDRVLSEAVELAQWLVDQGYSIEKAASMTSYPRGRWGVRQMMAAQQEQAA